MQSQNWSRYADQNAPMRPEYLTAFWTEYVQRLTTTPTLQMETVHPQVLETIQHYVGLLASHLYEIETAYPDLLGLAPNFPPLSFGQYKDVIRVLFRVASDNFSEADGKTKGHIAAMHGCIRSLNKALDENCVCAAL